MSTNLLLDRTSATYQTLAEMLGYPGLTNLRDQGFAIVRTAELARLQKVEAQFRDIALAAEALQAQAAVGGEYTE